MERHRQATRAPGAPARGARRASARPGGGVRRPARLEGPGRAPRRARHRGARRRSQEIARPGRRRPRISRRAWWTFPGRVRGGGHGREPLLEARGGRGALLARVRRGLSRSGSRCRDLPRRPLRPLRHPRAASTATRLPEVDDQRQGRPHHGGPAPRGASSPSPRGVDLERLRRRARAGAGRRPSASAARTTARSPRPSASACSFGRLGLEPARSPEALPTAARHPHAGAVQGRGRSRRTTGRCCDALASALPARRGLELRLHADRRWRSSSARASPTSSRPSWSPTRSAGASPSRVIFELALGRHGRRPPATRSSWATARHRRGGRAGRGHGVGLDQPRRPSACPTDVQPPDYEIRDLAELGPILRHPVGPLRASQGARQRPEEDRTWRRHARSSSSAPAPPGYTAAIYAARANLVAGHVHRHPVGRPAHADHAGRELPRLRRRHRRARR